MNERRRWLRIAPKASVSVQVSEHDERCRLGNLGEGGMFVQTTVTMPDRLLGRTAALAIRLDGGGAGWLTASGKLVRIQRTGAAFAFDTMSPALRRMLDETVARSQSHARVLSVVLIDGDGERRLAMAEGFRATGCAVVEAATPLEAIVRLGESSFEPDVIAIADSRQAAEADEMRRFVERAHPHARLITIGHDLLRPDGMAHWLSSANPDADLPARIRDQLVAPWRPRS